MEDVGHTARSYIAKHNNKDTWHTRTEDVGIRHTSFSARLELEGYFIHGNTGDGNREMQRMNHVNNHYRKCVMTLQSSDSSNSYLGSAAWFTRQWQSLLRTDKDAFKSNIEQKYLLEEGDFHVDMDLSQGDSQAMQYHVGREFNIKRDTQCECPVIFYLLSVLEPLVLRTFHGHVAVNPHSTFHHRESPWQQALYVLHNPSFGHNEYRSFLDEAHDAPENRGNPFLMRPLTATANLSALSSLLTQLRALNSGVSN